MGNIGIQPTLYCILILQSLVSLIVIKVIKFVLPYFIIIVTDFIVQE